MSLDEIVTDLNMNMEAPEIDPSSMVDTIQPGMIASPSVSSPSPPSIITTTSTGIDWMTILRYVAIIIILAFLGINVFSYIGDVIDFIESIFGPVFRKIASFFGFTVGETAKQTVKMSETGIIGGTKAVSGVAIGGIDALERVLTDAENQQKQRQTENIPKADDARSVTQLSKASGKSGYCYIGEDRGFRSCVKVSEGDKCMSGDIFPTREICMNPNLRQ